MARQRHPFVLPFFAATLDYPERCWVVTDVMKQTLVEWLHGTRERQYSRLIPLPPMKERVRVALEVRETGVLCVVLPLDGSENLMRKRWKAGDPVVRAGECVCE